MDQDGPNRSLGRFFLRAGLRLMGVKGEQKRALTEEEILLMVNEGGESGVIEESQAEMISNIFDFDDIEVREVMTHRTEMTAIEDNRPVTEAIKLIIDEGFSRIPVYHENNDNICGVVFAKDLLRLVLDDSDRDAPVSEFMRDIMFVPESNKCGELFEQFTTQRGQIAVVVDDYGGTAGIITMEDLLETIVGSIQDEYDDETEEIIKLSDGKLEVLGTAGCEEVMEALGREYDGDYDTIGGFVTELLGHIPEDGETAELEWKDIRFSIAEVSDKKIVRLRVWLKESK